MPQMQDSTGESGVLAAIRVGPAYSIPKARERTSLALKDIEINEAFANQVLAWGD